MRLRFNQRGYRLRVRTSVAAELEQGGHARKLRNWGKGVKDARCARQFTRSRIILSVTGWADAECRALGV
jgi:hypothetical protein